jgi:hypothetical protein
LEELSCSGQHPHTAGVLVAPPPGVAVAVCVGDAVAELPGVFVEVCVAVAVTAGVAVAVPLVHGIPEGFVHEQYMPLGIGG